MNVVHKKMQNPIRYILDECSGSTASKLIVTWIEFQVFDTAGNNIAEGIKPIYSFTPSMDVTGQSLPKIVTNGNISLNEYVSVNLGIQADKTVAKMLIDLGRPIVLSKIRIFHGWWSPRAYLSKIRVSTDGKKWQTLYDYTRDKLIYEEYQQGLTIET